MLHSHLLSYFWQIGPATAAVVMRGLTRGQLWPCCLANHALSCSLFHQ